MNIGYIRVSTTDQNTDRQLQGIDLDRTFTEKAPSKNTNRPELQKMLEMVREGDTIFVHSMDRLARNLKDLLCLIEELFGKGVSIWFIKEGQYFDASTGNPLSKLILSMIGAFAEFERNMIRQRQREGIAIAKEKGIYKGRQRQATPEQIANIKAEHERGVSMARLARDYGVTRVTIYNYINDVSQTGKQKKPARSYKDIRTGRPLIYRPLPVQNLLRLKTDGRFDARTSTIFSSFPDNKDYDYADKDRRADNIRSQATEELERELAETERSRVPKASETVGYGDGSRTEGQVPQTEERLLGGQDGGTELYQGSVDEQGSRQRQLDTRPRSDEGSGNGSFSGKRLRTKSLGAVSAGYGQAQEHSV
jgi:DNA invertase Pin-like site-specific DNA recombinase